jgi:hypothetical protein
MSRTTGEFGAFSASSDPASVEIATAPIFTQYGGERSDGCMAKNV